MPTIQLILLPDADTVIHISVIKLNPIHGQLHTCLSVTRSHKKSHPGQSPFSRKMQISQMPWIEIVILSSSTNIAHYRWHTISHVEGSSRAPFYWANHWTPARNEPPTRVYCGKMIIIDFSWLYWTSHGSGFTHSSSAYVSLNNISLLRWTLECVRAIRLVLARPENRFRVSSFSEQDCARVVKYLNPFCVEFKEDKGRAGGCMWTMPSVSSEPF